jgi:hypothetical protein
VFNYAAALMRNGMNSVAEFRRALELAPPDRKAVTLHHLGLAHYDQGEYDTGAELLRLASEHKATSPGQRLDCDCKARDGQAEGGIA